MGQAVVDLPDPLDNPTAGPGVNADDLLSKLAGDEIDRLLADNDEPAGHAPVGDVPIRAYSPEHSSGTAPGYSPSDKQAPAQPVPHSTSEDESAATIDDLLASAEADARFDADADLESRNAVVQTVSSAESHTEVNQPLSAPAVPAVDLDEVLNTADAARVALHVPNTVQGFGGETIKLDTGHSKRGTLSVLLRPLVWFSSPLDPWPDVLRETIGKIAVVTTVNALAVIAYVLIFRRHHH